VNPAFAICRSAAIVVDSVTKTNAVTESRVVESSAGRLPRGKIFEAAHNQRRTHLGVGGGFSGCRPPRRRCEQNSRAEKEFV